MKIQKALILLISILPLNMVFAYNPTLTKEDYNKHPPVYVSIRRVGLADMTLGESKGSQEPLVDVERLTTVITCDDIPGRYSFRCMGVLEDENTAEVNVAIATGTEAGMLEFTTTIGRGSRTVVATGANGKKYSLIIGITRSRVQVELGPNRKKTVVDCYLIEPSHLNRVL